MYLVGARFHEKDDEGQHKTLGGTEPRKTLETPVNSGGELELWRPLEVPLGTSVRFSNCKGSFFVKKATLKIFYLFQAIPSRRPLPPSVMIKPGKSATLTTDQTGSVCNIVPNRGEACHI